MKLNKVAKDELRKKIEVELKEVPEGQRIQLDKDLLEDLLFEVVTLNKEKDIKVKLPVWSGEFLRKIDLSQVDFTNVSWLILGNVDYFIEEFYDVIEDSVEEKLEKFYRLAIKNPLFDSDRMGKELNNAYSVFYKGTNAHIDLSQSFEAIYRNKIHINCCNFSGLDFSSQDLSNFEKLIIYSSDISDTRLSIPNNISLEAGAAILRGIDLSDRTIDGYKYLDLDENNLHISDLTNTGIKIDLNAESCKDFRNSAEFYDAMNHYWVGCYVNGKKILSSEEKKTVATKKKEEYEKMKAEIFNSVLGSIEEQKKPRAK